MHDPRGKDGSSAVRARDVPTPPAPGSAASRRADRFPSPSGHSLLWPLVAAVVSTGWLCRPFLSGHMLGDLGDARWTISLHEHWYRFWTGSEGFRDLLYYRPLTATLGTSDGFFLQGQLYTVARLLGLGLGGAWVAACAAYLLIGAAGVAVLSTRLLATTVGRIVFVVLTCTSYSVAANIGAHIQLIGVLSTSWVLLGLLDIASGRAVRRGVALVAVLPPLLALSTWYAVVLLAFFVIPLAGVLALLQPGARLRAVVVDRWRAVVTAVRTVPGAVAVAAGVVGWGAVLWVYLPGRHLFPAPSYLEVMLYSPQWSDLLNATAGGGGLWSGWYESVFGGKTLDELARGFTPFVAGFFLIGMAVLLRRVVLTGQIPEPTERAAVGPVRVAPGPVAMLAAGLAVIATLALILIDARGMGFYRLLWLNVPGFESIRTPFRVMDVLYGAVFFVLVRAMESWWATAHQQVARGVRGDRYPRLVFVVAAVMALLAVVEMHRPMYSDWRIDQVLPAGLAARVDEARARCDAVVVVQPAASGKEAETNADAVMFAVVADLPTPQGYSRGNPIGYPDQVGDGWPFVEWMRSQGYQGIICRVSDAGVEPFPASS